MAPSEVLYHSSGCPLTDELRSPSVALHRLRAYVGHWPTPQEARVTVNNASTGRTLQQREPALDFVTLETVEDNRLGQELKSAQFGHVSIQLSPSDWDQDRHPTIIAQVPTALATTSVF
jgi:hypothetical protein